MIHNPVFFHVDLDAFFASVDSSIILHIAESRLLSAGLVGGALSRPLRMKRENSVSILRCR